MSDPSFESSISVESYALTLKLKSCNFVSIIAIISIFLKVFFSNILVKYFGQMSMVGLQ